MFDNRGANLVNKLLVNKNGAQEKRLFGSAYELINDSVFDINAAIDFVNKLGYEEIYLIGGSTGANKICIYDHYREKNPVGKYVLISGGDDIGYYINKLGREKYQKLLEESIEKINQNKGENIIEELLPTHFLSYKTCFDLCL